MITKAKEWVVKVIVDFLDRKILLEEIYEKLLQVQKAMSL